MSDNWFYNAFINEVKSIGRSGLGSCSCSVSKAVAIDLPSDNWIEEGNLYTQVINISSITSNKQIEIRSSPEQLYELLESGISLTAINDSGLVKIVAIGGKPTSDYSVQIIMSDVEVV